MDAAVAARLHNLYWSVGTVAFIIVGSAGVGYLARFIARVRGASSTLQRRTFWGYAMASPWILGFLIFVLGPSVASLYYSFTDYRLGRPLEWIGLDNYQTLLAGAGAHGRRFMQAMANSFYYAVVGVPLQIVTALLMAMLLARPVPGMSIFRLIFYVPVILAGGPAILLAWRYMLASNGGFINVSLQSATQSVPGFDTVYRGFIYLTESFNAFYSAASRGDPVGPLMYAFPAALLAGLCVAFALLPRDSARRMARTVLEITLGLLAVVVLRLAIIGELQVLSPLRLGWDRLRTWFELATFRSSLRSPGELDYLTNGYSAHAPSPLWLLVVLAVVAALLLSGRVRGELARWLPGVVAVFAGLLVVGSSLDGALYFRAFDVAASETGQVHHHFALFRQVSASWPGPNRVPLWLSNELWSKPSLVLITVWSSGAAMLIFLAALKGVPRVLYEAAEVDGAGSWQRFWRVTLPLITPALFYNVVIGLIAALQTFEAVYLIQTQQTEQSLSSAAYFLFVRTFNQLEIGQGAAASWILAVIIVLLTAAQFRYSRWVHYG